jgi:Cellulose binding domain
MARTATVSPIRSRPPVPVVEPQSSRCGANVTATPLHWNRTIQPGASTRIGFQETWTTSNPEPTAFTLNGTPCTIS